jgi:hypothetical protein
MDSLIANHESEYIQGRRAGRGRSYEITSSMVHRLIGGGQSFLLDPDSEEKLYKWQIS